MSTETKKYWTVDYSTYDTYPIYLTEKEYMNLVVEGHAIFEDEEDAKNFLEQKTIRT